MKTTKRHFRSEAGFTMIELVIAVIIIAILVAILIPILQERAAQAKYTAAKADLEIIAAAQERAAIDTGYMYRLFMLDDTGGVGDGANDPRTGIDALADEEGRTDIQTVNADNFFIDPVTGSFIDGVLAGTILDRLETEYASERLDITAGKWNGPYMNWSRDGDILSPTDPLKGDDIPNDPWGNNYILITQRGVVFEDNQQPASPPTNATMDVNTITLNGVQYPVRNFDRPTVVSMGPDGLPGGTGNRVLGEADDLIRQW